MSKSRRRESIVRLQKSRYGHRIGALWQHDVSTLYGFFQAAARRSKRGYRGKLHRCNDAGEAARVLSRDLGGCSLEQDGVDFYIVGADAVRKKLNETPEYSVLDCGGVDFKEHEFGQWHHGYHFTKVSEIPNFGSMVHGKDFFIEVYNGGTNQLNAGIGVSYVKHSNSELVMTSVNGLKGLYVKVYYINNRAIPAPSSFLKSIDFTIASGTATKNILLADIPDAGEIVCAGLVSRGWEGWNALNVTYTAESVTITFSTSGHNGSAFGSEVVRVWYR